MESIEFLGFGLNAWITIVTVFSMFTVLLFTKWRSDIVFLAQSHKGHPNHRKICVAALW
jgi:hypothetical protein